MNRRAKSKGMGCGNLSLNLDPVVRIRMPDFRKINEIYEKRLEEVKISDNEYVVL